MLRAGVLRDGGVLGDAEDHPGAEVEVLQVLPGPVRHRWHSVSISARRPRGCSQSAWWQPSENSVEAWNDFGPRIAPILTGRCSWTGRAKVKRPS